MVRDPIEGSRRTRGARAWVHVVDGAVRWCRASSLWLALVVPLGAATGCASGPTPIQEANALMRQQRFDEAIERFREALLEQPNNGSLYLGLGAAYVNVGKIDLAEQALARAAELGEKLRANLTLAKVRRAQRRYPEAAGLLDDALALAPNEWQLHWELGLVQLEAGDNSTAAESFQTVITLQPTLTEAYVRFAEALRALGRHQEAVEVLQEAVTTRRGPELVTLQTALGETYEALGNAVEADLVFRRALSKDPKHVPAIAGQARTLCAQGQYADAIEMLIKALRDAPKDAGLHLELGLAYDAFKVPDKALETLLLAVSLDASQIRAYPILLRLLDKAGDAEQRYDVLTKAAAAIPDDPALQLRYAKAAYEHDDAQATKIAARRVVELQPADLEANYLLALAQRRLGEIEASEESLAAVNILDSARANRLQQELAEIDRIRANGDGPADGEDRRKRGKGKTKRKRKRR